MEEEVDVDCFDMDSTKLNTPDLLRPVVQRVAEIADKTVTEVNQSRWKVGEITFTFADWFRDVGIEEDRWSELETELRGDMALRARDCLYPGIYELLNARKTAGARLVLITAGDPFYQRWKFSLLGLDHLFAVDDRNYVPRYGSKAEVLRHYLAYGRVRLIDDGVPWLIQVAEERARDPKFQVECFRARWSSDPRSVPHPEDNELWRVVHTPAELLALLQG